MESWKLLGLVAVVMLYHGNASAQKKTLNIVSILSPPFLMQKEQPKDGPPLVGNARYEGYAMDLATKIFQNLGTDFVMTISKDGMYGSRKGDGTWNGMVGELIRQEVDAAVAPLTISSMRERVIDFSKPFMSTGITMVTKKTLIPFDEAFGSSCCLLLQPFRVGVWIIIIVAFVLISVLVGVIERMTAAKDVSIVSSIGGGFWWTVQALYLQGFSGRGPRSLGSKILLVFWFAFSLITISMYIASMSNVLTAEGNFVQNQAGGTRPDFINKQSNIRSVDDLANQNEVKYGAIGPSSSTYNFFRVSKVAVYEKIHAGISSFDDVLVKSYDEGIKKVQEGNGKYAFFMESQAADYYLGQDCDLQKVGGLLTSSGYGVATPQGSNIRDLISMAILQLSESGELQQLYQKWWYDRGECAYNHSTVAISYGRDLMVGRKIDIRQFTGPAVLLLLGIIIGVVCTAVDCIRGKRNDGPSDGPEGTALKATNENA